MRWRLEWQLTLLACTVALSLAVPPTRLPLLVLSNWVAVALVVVGVRRHRPERRDLWRLVLLFVALVATGNTCLALTSENWPGTVAATTAGQLAAAAALGKVMRGGRARRRSLDSALDLTLLGVAGGLGAAEMLRWGLAQHRTHDIPWPMALAPAIDVALTAVLLWLVLSRARLVPAMLLTVAGGFGCLTFDLFATTGGHRVALPGQWLQSLGIVNMVLFGLAAVQPSMALLGNQASFARARRSSVQLLLVLPLALTPVVLLLTGPWQGAVAPSRLVLGAGVVVVLLAALARAVLAVRETERAAERDALTGLLNRRGLTEAYAAMAVADSRPARWLLLVDLDDFKRVNDRYGHSTGDGVLMAAAERLRAAIGDGGAVARHGGDEFIVLVDAPSGALLVDPGAAVVAALANPVEVDGHLLPVTASVGVVPVGPGQDLEWLLANADIAMYTAKRDAKSTAATFHPDQRDRLLQELATAEELRALLDGGAAAGGQLRVLYQPIVELSGDRLVGVEALVRWQHPTRGLLAPDAFLALAEREGLGVALDDAVLHLALEQLGRWDREQLGPLTLSVNLGLSSTCDAGLPSRVLAATAAHGIAPSRLRLEITEQEALPDTEATRAALRALVDGGVALSLDDFGVGYTALSYLQRYPISLLKIDRSLLGRLEPAGLSLLAGIVALGGALGLDVLAEGVETAEQQDAVRRLGVEYGQGYHFARPLSAEDLSRWAAERSRRLLAVAV